MYLLKLGPLYYHCDIGIGGGPLIGLGPLGPLPYPLNLRGKPVYHSLGGHKVIPRRKLLVPGPLQLLTHICYLLAETSVGINPVFDLSHYSISSFPCLHQNALQSTLPCPWSHPSPSWPPLASVQYPSDWTF